MSFRNPLTGPVTISGAVAVSGITNPVDVQTSGGRTVTQTGAATTLAPPAGTPSAAARAVSASSQASASQTNNGTVTLIAAPGVAKQLELHLLSCTTLWALGTAGVAIQVQLQRSDNAAVLWDSGLLKGAAASQPINQFTFDFQGATLPANVGVNLVVLNAGVSPTQDNATVNLVYNTLS